MSDSEKITLYRYDERENSIVSVDAHKVENMIRIRFLDLDHTVMWDEINNIGVYATEAEAAVARRDQLAKYIPSRHIQYVRADACVALRSSMLDEAQQKYEEAVESRERATERLSALRNKLEKAEEFVATITGDALKHP